MDYERELRHKQPVTLGADVFHLERRLGLVPTGVFTSETAKAVRRFQADHGLLATGVVDEQTWLALEAGVHDGLTPDWFASGDFDEVRRRLGVADDEELEPRIRRFQSALGLPVSGEVDERTAIAIGG